MQGLTIFYQISQYISRICFENGPHFFPYCRFLKKCSVIDFFLLVICYYPNTNQNWRKPRYDFPLRIILRARCSPDIKPNPIPTLTLTRLKNLEQKKTINLLYLHKKKTLISLYKKSAKHETATKGGFSNKQTTRMLKLSKLTSTWSGRGDLQPVGTLLRAVAFVGRNAGLLPELVLPVIEQRSWWTFTLLAGKNAVKIFAGEIN